jgi:hypothetical protein
VKECIQNQKIMEAIYTSAKENKSGTLKLFIGKDVFPGKDE